MTKRFLTCLLILYVVLDLLAAFWLNYHLPLDGDLPAVVLPAPFYSQVLHDPLGWQALTRHAIYAAPNRFFAHAEMLAYWNSVPFLLQRLLSPVDSLYVASAVFATATQAGLLLMLASYVRLLVGSPQRWGWHFWLAAALLVPLFQSGGFYEQIGIIDVSITYVFFYGFALLLLLVLLWPFARAASQGQPLRLPLASCLLLLALMPVVALNGSAAVAAAILVLFEVAVYWVWRKWQQPASWLPLRTGWISTQAVVLLLIFGLLLVYSLYLGRFNIENGSPKSLTELYAMLGRGLPAFLAYQPALYLLLGLLALNTLLTWWATAPSQARRRVLAMVGWAALFTVLYVGLLPLGGSRSYRPNMLRNDIILPAMLALLLAYGLSSIFLLSQLRRVGRGSYAVLLAVFCGYFAYADRLVVLPPPYNNDCERWAFDQLARSSEPVVQLSPDCLVLMWSVNTYYPQSEIPAQMLKRWGITSGKRLYYQQ